VSAVPAWSVPDEGAQPVPRDWPDEVTRDWAWGGSTGAGVRVGIVDSGVEGGHPLVGAVEHAYVVDGDGVHEEDAVDLIGHGTACAGIVRSLAPACELGSVRVLGGGLRGNGSVLLAGVRFAIEQGYDLVNLSLSTAKLEVARVLHELTDAAYFRRTTIVAAAHNLPVESYPWKFASVVSVGSHAEPDPLAFYVNARPPVEFFARGVLVDVAWKGGATMRSTGNSFATPHVAGICALVLGKHPRLTPFQLKSVLYLTASNVA
jgi:subtilisin family serine protease